MRILIFIYLTIISLIGCAQIESINSIFFDFPLHEKRDSICQFLHNSNSFTIEKNEYEIHRNDTLIPSFSAYYNQSTLGDSTFIQLTSGSVKNENSSEWKPLLIFSINYEFSNKRKSNKNFNHLVDQIENLSINKNLIGYNSPNDKKSTMKKWSLNDELGVQVSIESKKNNQKKYIITLEYSRYENKN